MKVKDEKGVTIWAESPFQLYSVVEYVRVNQLNPNRVTLITELRNEAIIGKTPLLCDMEIVIIDHLKKKWHAYFQLFFETLLVPDNFSNVYSYNKEFNTKRHPFLKFLKKYTLVRFPKHRLNEVFDLLVRALSIFSPTPDRVDTVYCITKIHHAVLLSLMSVKRIAIMESWDHPMKFPFLFKSDKAYTWNKSLRLDIEKFQGIQNVSQITPLKFNYIDRFQPLSLDEIEERLIGTAYSFDIKALRNKRIVLYPTSSSSIGMAHEGEKMVIEKLCEIFKDSDYHLYIKPKPNGPEGDYDAFKSLANVIVGKYSSGFDAKDMLDENYHLFRYYLIQKAEMSINAGTTFGLEIAYAGKPLIQLDVAKEVDDWFNKALHTYHLVNYLLSHPGVTPFNKDTSFEILDKVKNKDMEFSQALKKWLLEW